LSRRLPKRGKGISEEKRRTPPPKKGPNHNLGVVFLDSERKGGDCNISNFYEKGARASSPKKRASSPVPRGDWLGCGKAETRCLGGVFLFCLLGANKKKGAGVTCYKTTELGPARETLRGETETGKGSLPLFLPAPPALRGKENGPLPGLG